MTALRFDQAARGVGRLLQQAARCGRCGKNTLVLNAAAYRRPFAGEAITADSHCTCRGGLARHLVQASIDRGGHCFVCGAVEFEHEHGKPTVCDGCWTPDMERDGLQRAVFADFAF